MHETPISLDTLIFVPRFKVHKGMIVEGNLESQISPNKSLPVDSDYAAIAYEVIKYIQGLLKPQPPIKSLKKRQDYDEIPMTDFATIPSSPFPSLPLEISATIFSFLASSISDIELLKLRTVNKLFCEFVNMFIWESVSRHLHLRRLKTPFLHHEDFPLFKVQLRFTFQFEISNKRMKRDRDNFHDLIIIFVPNENPENKKVLDEAISNIDYWGMQGNKFIIHTEPSISFFKSGWRMMDLKDAQNRLFGADEYLKHLTFYREGFPESFVHKINRKAGTFCLLLLSILSSVGMFILTGFGSACYKGKTCSNVMLVIGCVLSAFFCFLVVFLYRIYWVKSGICGAFFGYRDGEFRTSGIKPSDYSSCC